MEPLLGNVRDGTSAHVCRSGTRGVHVWKRDERMTARSDREVRPVLFSGGDRLREWIEAGGSPARPAVLGGFRLRWSGFWFDRYAAITARRCGNISLPRDPIFILGLWR